MSSVTTSLWASRRSARKFHSMSWVRRNRARNTKSSVSIISPVSSSRSRLKLWSMLAAMAATLASGILNLSTAIVLLLRVHHDRLDRTVTKNNFQIPVRSVNKELGFSDGRRWGGHPILDRDFAVHVQLRVGRRGH